MQKVKNIHTTMARRESWRCAERRVEKGVYFIGALEGLWPPIGLTKISKMGGVMDRCLKTEIFITLHFWGVKGGEKVH